MGKRKVRKTYWDSILPRSGLNPGFLPDKGEAGISSFNNMQGNGNVAGAMCEVYSLPDEDDRSEILITAKWVNPYTNKEDEFTTWLPNECLEKNLVPYFKSAFNIDIGDKDKFIEMLDILGCDLKDLDSFADLINLCIKDYYETPFYENDKKYALDDYELLNDLGEYSEEDDYAE